MPLPLFLIPILSGLIAQALKPLLNRQFYSTLEITGRQIPRYGGMPSAHSAFAASLVTITAASEGFTSLAFAISISLYILVIDDALRMRMFLGHYGAALVKLIKTLPTTEQKEYPYLEARLGHKPREVIAGTILGISISLLIILTLAL